jgi:hypothetical protein
MLQPGISSAVYLGLTFTLIRGLVLPDVYLVVAAPVGALPEIRFVNSVVQIHIVTSTFRADGPLFQVVLSFLFRDQASRGATEPIYGLRDDAFLRTGEVTLCPAEIGKQLANLAIAQSIQAISQCAIHNHCVQVIPWARRLTQFPETLDQVADALRFIVKLIV